VFVTLLARVGCSLIGLAAVALGIQSVWLRIYVGRLQPVPDWVPGHDVIAVATGLFLLAAGLCLVSGKWARLAATALAAMLLLWVVVLHLPRTFRVPAAWLGTFETFAVFGGVWLLAATLPIERKPYAWDRLVDRGRMLGRLCFGVSLPVFGLSHFIYHGFVATWVPTWLGFPQFWAYFTGAAHVAAGVAILANVLPRLAATLAGVMYGSWVLIVHIPRVAAAVRDAFEWNGIFVASALCASALLVAGTTVSDSAVSGRKAD
jgi:uncharacterized membrane protein YphA (DoxX/SURF4 family)